MGRNSYRFRSVWRLNAPPDDVFRALAELDDYPLWWPEVRAVHRLPDDEARRLVCRSLLPYNLVFTLRQIQRDRRAGILEAGLDGDLEGRSRWTVGTAPAGTVAVFDQEVAVNKSLLRRLSPIGRPAFVANHTLMMRHGLRGVTAYLAGLRRGRESAAPDRSDLD